MGEQVDSDYSTLTARIISTLRQKTFPFAQQLDILQDVIQSKTATNRDHVLDDLTTLLVPVYPGIEIRLFGSAALDLDVPGSPLDVYVGNVEITTTEQTSLQLLRTVISCCGKFDNILVTARGQFPQLKCRHTATQITCFLSINKSVMRSTELIKYYLSLDEKIRPLLLTLKFWAKYHGVVQEQGFSTYVLYLLVVFYLQQEPYKLPGLVSLREEEHTWCTPNEMEFPDLKNATIFELVSGLFKFYDTFDYVSYVVAPFCGLALDKTCFLKPCVLPSCYGHYIDLKKILDVDCGMCVQDPFNLALNFLNGTPLTSGGNFTSQCRNSLITRECPFLTSMLRLSENQRFTINKLEGFTEDEWASCVIKVTSSILDRICGYQMKVVRVKPHQYLYNCSGLNMDDFWESRVQVLKDLQSEWSAGSSEMCKEIDVTTSYIRARSKQETSKKSGVIIEVKFGNNPGRVDVCFKKLDGDTHFEHYFRVKMVAFLKEMAMKKYLSGQDGAKAAQGKFTDLKLLVNAFIQKDNTFAEQVAKLQTQFEEYTQHMETVRDDLATILLPWFPGSTVHLATANLDILSSFLHLCVGGTETHNSAIFLIQNVIRQSGKFDSVKIIAAAEIWCRHVKTHTLCHVNVNDVVVKRARLIENYMNLEDKVYTLLLVITYWAHCYELVSPEGLSTYSLCLLVIFYLQQKPYKLPAVKDLQPDFKTRSNFQKASLFDLVNGFFKFYDNFDYLYFMITPYCGYAIEKTRFLKPYDLPACYSDYAKQRRDLSVNVIMCVQDPFDHCKNVLQGASALCGGSFAWRCRHSIITTSDEDLLLYNVLNQPQCRKLSINKVDNCSLDEWLACLESITPEVLRKIFHFTVTDEEWKPEIQQVSYNCAANSDVWKGRISVLKSLLSKFPAGITEMEKEIAVTSQTLKRNKAEAFKRNIIVDLMYKMNPTRVEIVVRGCDVPSRKLDMEQFLRVKLGQFINESLCDKTQSTTSEQAVPSTSDFFDSSPSVLLKRKTKSRSSDSGDERSRSRSSRSSRSLKRNQRSSESRSRSISLETKRAKRAQSGSEHSSDPSKSRSIEKSASRSRSRSRGRDTRSRLSEDSQKQLLEQRKSFLEEVRETLKEVSTPVVPLASFLNELNIFGRNKSPPGRVLGINEANLRVVPTVDSLPDQTEVLTEMVLVLLDEARTRVQEQKDKIMLQCLKTLNVMTFQTSKPLRVVPPRQPRTKPPGHPSPLLKSQKKFKFTFVSQKNCVNRFERILLQILRALGICSESDDISEVMDEVVEALGSKDGVDKETAAKILQISLLGAMEGFKSPEMVDVGTQCCMEKKGTEAWVLRDPRRASMFYMETENGKTGNSRVVLEQLQLKEMSY